MGADLPLNISLAITGLLILLLTIAGDTLKYRLYLSEPLVATLIGILIGPSELGLLDLPEGSAPPHILEIIARLTLGVSLFAVAVRLPPFYMRREWKSLALLLGMVMPAMWISASLVIAFLPGATLLTALLAGAIVTPTDPVVSSTIVTGRLAETKISGEIRDIISAESGANDVLAFPFIMLPLLLMDFPAGEAVREWLIQTILYQIIGATLLGLLVGYLTARLMIRLRHGEEEVEPVPLVVIGFALSLTIMSGAELIGSNGLLAAFIAGLAFISRVKTSFQRPMREIQEEIQRFFDLPVFVLFGMVLPWDRWREWGWPLPAVALAVLFVRRIPSVLALYQPIRMLKDVPDALFVGWFGPVGVAALYYSAFSVRMTGDAAVWIIASMIVFGSIVLHGVSSTPFTRLYGKKKGGAGGGAVSAE